MAIKFAGFFSLADVIVRGVSTKIYQYTYGMYLFCTKLSVLTKEKTVRILVGFFFKNFK